MITHVPFFFAVLCRAPRVLPTRALGSTGVTLPVVGFPGISPTPDACAGPTHAEGYVEAAVEAGSTYIGVAPEYGDGCAQARLGPALGGVRDHCFLACKTMPRTAEGATEDMATNLAALNEWFQHTGNRLFA